VEAEGAGAENEEAEEDGQDDEYAHVGGASGLFASEKVSDGPTL